jgi:hypothetical protein
MTLSSCELLPFLGIRTLELDPDPELDQDPELDPDPL